MKNLKTFENIFDDISEHGWIPTKEEMDKLVQHFEYTFEQDDIRMYQIIAGDAPVFNFEFGKIDKITNDSTENVRKCSMLIQTNMALLIIGGNIDINQWKLVPTQGSIDTGEMFDDWAEAVYQLETIIEKWYNYKDSINDHIKKINDLYEETNWSLGEVLSKYKVRHPN